MDSMMMGAQPLPQQGPPMGGPVGPMMEDPSMGMAPGAGGATNPYPSTDPAVIAQIVALIGGLQQEDHMNLQMQQDGVLQMLLSSLMPPAQDPMALPSDAGFVEGGDSMLAAPDQMMM